MKRIIHFSLIALTLIVLNSGYVVPVVLAANTGGAPSGGPLVGGQPASETSGGGLTNPLGSIDSLPEFMTAILRAIVTLGSIVLTLAIIYVGFLFVKAQGNAEQISAARSALLWTVIGGLILLGAETVGLVIENTVESL